MRLSQEFIERAQQRESDDVPVIGRKFRCGDQVEVNGNNDARILYYYSANMVVVRLWQGLRHVGDVCVDVSDVKLIA